LFFEPSVASSEPPLGDTKQIGDRLEALHPADDLAGSNGRVDFHAEPMINHLAQHARGEFCQADSPDVVFLPRDPEVRRAVQVFHWEMGCETRPLVMQSLWPVDFHDRDSTGSVSV